MDKKKIGIAVGCAAVAAVIAICAVTFGGKKGDAAEPAATVETAATAEPTSTPEPTAAPTPVVTAAPQPVVTAAPQPVQQEPSSDGGDVPDWFDDSWTGNSAEEQQEIADMFNGAEWE